MKYQCAHCGNTADKPAGHVNRARARGLNLYCNRICSGFGRRHGKTKEQLVAEKAAYDAAYRAQNIATLKAKKIAYHRATYDPAKAAEHRQTRMPYHVEYCRRPEYRAWKRDYDRKYRAEQEYGEFAECFLLVMDIRDECLSQMTDYEIRYAKGGVGKTQQRKRAYDRSLREKPEGGSLGHLELGQGWQNGGLASGLRRLPGARNSAHDEHSVARSSAVEASGFRGRDQLRGDVRASAFRSQNGGAL